MFRKFAIAASLTALTITAAQALTLDARVHIAAVAACAPESSSSLPLSHYGSISQSCVDRVSAATLRKMKAQAQAKTEASTASIAN